MYILFIWYLNIIHYIASDSIFIFLHARNLLAFAWLSPFLRIFINRRFLSLKDIWIQKPFFYVREVFHFNFQTTLFFTLWFFYFWNIEIVCFKEWNFQEINVRIFSYGNHVISFFCEQKRIKCFRLKLIVKSWFYIYYLYVKCFKCRMYVSLNFLWCFKTEK